MDKEGGVSELFEHLPKDAFTLYGEYEIMNHMSHLGGVYDSKKDEPLILISNTPIDVTTLPTYR